MVRVFLACRTHVRALARQVARLLAAHALPRAFFSLLVQRKEPKESTPLAACPSLRSGSAIVPGISGRGILPLPETAHVPVRRPSGFTRPACHALTGARRATATATATAPSMARVPLLILIWPLGPHPQRWRRRANPQGAAQDARRFGSAHGCAVPKFPPATRTPTVQPLGREDRGVLSLLTFFAQAKKVRPRGERTIAEDRWQ